MTCLARQNADTELLVHMGGLQGRGSLPTVAVPGSVEEVLHGLAEVAQLDLGRDPLAAEAEQDGADTRQIADPRVQGGLRCALNHV